MNKGICFYFGFASNPEDRVKKIKQAGFDCVITNADKKFDDQNGTIAKQVKLFKKYGLKLSSLHARYDCNVVEFWEEGKLGEKYKHSIVKDIKIAKKYGFTCVVVHLSGKPSEIGFKRFEFVLKNAEKYKVPIAVENLKNTQLLKQIFKRYNSEYLKMCYDSGHNNVYTPNFDFLENYKDKIICLHLHDNLGAKAKKTDLKPLQLKRRVLDLHTLNKYGNINWNEQAKKLSKVPFEINLDYEVMMHAHKGETEEEVLSEVYKQACQLEQKIENYRQ